MLILILVVISIILAINMGASGFSVSFTPSCGSDCLKHNRAVVLYTIFVFFGAILIGSRVVTTLTQKISYQQINPISALIILIAATITMFTANILKIPQSTSFVTVSAFTGAALYYQKVNWNTIATIFYVAAIFSVLSFTVTYFVARLYYPPRDSNFRFYEKIFPHRNKLRKFIIAHDCYCAFAIGTNNVANIVAPLLSGITVNPILALAVTAPLFGLGGYTLGKGVLNTIAQEIVPIGELSASVISIVTASFVVIASLLGLPTPYVQFATFSVLAISTLKDGFKSTLRKETVKKIFYIWIIVPLVTVGVSYLLHLIFI